MAERLTGGARFDPGEGFCYFLCGVLGTVGIVDRHEHNLVAVNDLIGPGARSDLDRVLDDPAQKVLLDSGVFWLASTHAARYGLPLEQALGLPPDQLDGWERLLAAYVELARELEARLWGYVELDQGGPLYKQQTRDWLEAQGLRPIPVYHPLTDGWDYLDQLLEEGYDRLMIGNVVQARWEVRDRIILTVWERVRRHPHGRRPWVHLLGLGPYQTLAACPFNSTDTSNHIQSMQYGAIIPGGLGMGPISRLYGYLYDREHVDDPETGRLAYGRFLGWLASADEQAWRAQEGDLDALLGRGPFPALTEHEAQAVFPEAA
jgi:hypothetical protein